MTQHTIKKLSAAIDATTIVWENGVVMQGEFVSLKRKDAIALLQLLRPDDKEVPDFIQPAIASQDDDQPSQAVGAIATASIPQYTLVTPTSHTAIANASTGRLDV